MVLSAIPSDGVYKDVRRCWCLLVAYMRAMLLPDVEYQAFMRAHRGYVLKWRRRFYTLYSTIFGREACSSNTHALWHLLHFRDVLGPLTEHSAFKYESSYGTLRTMYRPTNCSPGLQAMRGFYLRSSVGHHCQTSLLFRATDTGKRCDSLVYTTDGKMWRVLHVNNPARLLRCRPLICDAPTEFGRGLVWTKLGVYHFKRDGPTEQTIPFGSVAGKAIRVGKHLVKISRECLVE